MSRNQKLGENSPDARDSLGPGRGWCGTFHITGYTPRVGNTTADGTSVWVALANGDPVIAAHRNIPMGSRVEIAGIGDFRVADRGGGLGPMDLDILVASEAEAYALTGDYAACVR